MPTNEFLPFATDVGANVIPQGTYQGAAFQLDGFQVGIADPASCNKVWRQPAFVASCIAQWMSTTAGANVLDNGDQGGFIATFEAALNAYISGIITGGQRPPVTVSGPLSITSGSNQGAYFCNAAVSVTLSATGTLANGLWFDLWAANGDVVFQPQAGDRIYVNGAVAPTAGAPFTIPSGTHVLVFTNGATNGNWYVFSDLLMIQNSLPQYGVDTGSANAYAVTYSPARTTHVAGVPLTFKAANANTGASTFNPGPGVKPLVRPDLTQLVQGDIVPGAMITTEYDGTTQYVATAGLTNGFKQTAANNGYVILPNGIIIQWGRYTGTITSQAPINITFPISFPNNCYMATGIIVNSSAGIGLSSDLWLQLVNRTTTVVTFVSQGTDNGPWNLQGVDWLAMGK